jgi:hypothetical protein
MVRKCHMLVIRMRLVARVQWKQLESLGQQRGLAIKETLPLSCFWSKRGTLFCYKCETMGAGNEK